MNNALARCSSIAAADDGHVAALTSSWCESVMVRAGGGFLSAVVDGEALRLRFMVDSLSFRLPSFAVTSDEKGRGVVT